MQGFFFYVYIYICLYMYIYIYIIIHVQRPPKGVATPQICLTVILAIVFTRISSKPALYQPQTTLTEPLNPFRKVPCSAGQPPRAGLRHQSASLGFLFAGLSECRDVRVVKPVLDSKGMYTKTFQHHPRYLPSRALLFLLIRWYLGYLGW